MKYIGLLILLASFHYSCTTVDNKPLPKIGFPTVVDGDTIPHTISSFSLLNQDSILIDNSYFSESIYLSDFFFMHCPTICPRVKKQMLRLYEHYEDNPKVKFVSHTLDPKRDTPSKLKEYAQNLEVNHSKWLFLTGDKDHIYDIKNDYFVAAMEDDSAPGGITHSGQIILVDSDGHVRSYVEGTDPKEVDKMFNNIDKLLKEYASK